MEKVVAVFLPIAAGVPIVGIQRLKTL
ncbi:uncharacterized protein METZ01_LOCUS489738 [marine metagenome]|uniref:Uncharacterized protein n=1 Tax=marine metagenome TaxID=408172 RepID=A0A383CXS6_9ZZZZ